MEKMDPFSLIRKEARAIEKVAPGAGNILSRMTSDALTISRNEKLPKPLLTALLCDDMFNDSVEILIKSESEEHYRFRFFRFESGTELFALTQKMLLLSAFT